MSRTTMGDDGMLAMGVERMAQLAVPIHSATQPR
jgi:hypothetical protein